MIVGDEIQAESGRAGCVNLRPGRGAGAGSGDVRERTGER